MVSRDSKTLIYTPVTLSEYQQNVWQGSLLMWIGEIWMARAIFFYDRPCSFRNSALNISPGVTGANSSQASLHAFSGSSRPAF
jgi:hypothetical protein